MNNPSPSSSPAAGLIPSRGLLAAVLPAHTGQGLTTAMIAPVVPAIAAYFGGGKGGDFAAQLVAVTPFAGIIVGGLISGWAIKSTGLRAYILLASALFGLGGIIGLLAPTLPIVLVGSVALGFGAIFVLSGLSALTSMVYEGSERAKVVGMQAGLAGFTNIVLSLVGAFLSELLGWRVPFAFFLAFGAILTTLVLLFIPKIERNPAAPKVMMAAMIGSIWPVLLAGGMCFMMLVAQSTQLPFLLAENGVTSSGMRGVVLTLVHASSVVGSISYGWLDSRVRPATLILAIGIIGVAGWCLFGLWSGGLPVVMLASAMVGTCQGLVVPMLFAGAMRKAPGEASGPAIGLLNVAICFGAILNPALTSPIMDVTGRSGLMFVLAGVTAAVAIVALLWRRSSPDGSSGPMNRSMLTQSGH